MTGPAPDRAEKVAEVLAVHRLADGFYGDAGPVWRSYACTCGWWSTADQERDHRAHQAAAVLEALDAQDDRAAVVRTVADDEVAAAAKAEGLREAAEDVRRIRTDGRNAAMTRRIPRGMWPFELAAYATLACEHAARIVTRARDAIAERVDIGGQWARETGEDE